MSEFLPAVYNETEILHVNMGRMGGASQAAKRLNRNLQDMGFRSNLFFLEETRDYLGKALQRIGSKADYEIQKKQESTCTNTLLSGPGSSRMLIDLIETIPNETVLHFHWIPGGWSRQLLSKLKVRKVVITLHDMRYLTGYCHHSGSCNGYRYYCKSCPQAPRFLQAKIEKDFSHYSDSFRELQNTIMVAPSKWIYGLAKSALPTRNLPIHQIYNPIPECVFNMTSRGQTRVLNQRLNFLINGSQNPSKGGKDALDLLVRIKDYLPLQTTVFVLGRKFEGFETLNQVEVENIESEEVFAKFLSTIDFLLHLSQVENSPNLIREAQAVGVSVITSNVGGSKELILSEKTGLSLPISDEAIIDFIKKGIENTKLARDFLIPDTRIELSENYIMAAHAKLYKDFS
jgi:glycosyltransferase involved in cell wall biosynthesis